MRDMTTMLEESGSLSEIYTPEAVMPDQFFERPSIAGESGERSLQWAVFSDAIDCYQQYARSRTKIGRREFNRAKAWISRNDWEWMYSFVNLCTVFGFDINAVRDALRRCEVSAEPVTESLRRRFRHAA